MLLKVTNGSSKNIAERAKCFRVAGKWAVEFFNLMASQTILPEANKMCKHFKAIANRRPSPTPPPISTPLSFSRASVSNTVVFVY
jgi:hypothetical protein